MPASIPLLHLTCYFGLIFFSCPREKLSHLNHIYSLPQRVVLSSQSYLFLVPACGALISIISIPCPSVWCSHLNHIYSLPQRVVLSSQSYLFLAPACGAVIPFIAVFLKSLRLTAAETGVVTGASVIVAAFLRTGIGVAADKLAARKVFLMISCCGKMILFSFFLLISVTALQGFFSVRMYVAL